MILLADESTGISFFVTLAFTAGFGVGAVAAWFIKQWLNLSTIRRNEAEIRDKTRQLQESLDERETQHRNADRECGEYFEQLQALVDHGTAKEIAATRNLFCTCLNTMVIPTYAQLIRRRVLYCRDNHRQVSEIVAAATKEIRDWLEYMLVINDPKLLKLAEQSQNTISKHDLTELRQCVVEVVEDTAEKTIFLESLNNLIASGANNE